MNGLDKAPAKSSTYVVRHTQMDKRWSHCTFPHAWLAGWISKSAIMLATARSCGFDHKWLQVWAVVVKVKGGGVGRKWRGWEVWPYFL